MWVGVSVRTAVLKETSRDELCNVQRPRLGVLSATTIADEVVEGRTYGEELDTIFSSLSRIWLFISSTYIYIVCVCVCACACVCVCV